MAYRREVMACKRKGLSINDLPDNLLIFILSKISLKQAVCCSVVSKRWKFLWKFLQNLKFSSDFFSSSCSPHGFQNIIDGIFELHSGSLEFFELNNIRSCCTSDMIYEWIRRAALKDVREIRIENNKSQLSKFEVPTSIFLCHTLRSLALKHFVLTTTPDSFSGFASLTTLNFYNVELNDKIIELMLQLCPVLEILVVGNCSGLEKLKICSDSLISLNLSSQIRAMIANCARLQSLVIKDTFHRVEIDFYLPACLSLCTNVKLEAFTTLKSLRKITFTHGCFFLRDVMILREFPDLEQICIHKAEWAAMRFSRQFYENIKLRNLKWIHLNITSFAQEMLPLFHYLFDLAPAMKTLLASRNKGFDGINGRRFVNQLLNLQKPSTETKILISGNKLKEARCLNCDLDKLILTDKELQ